MIQLNEFNRDLFNNINRDQFVPDVKMEDEEQSYYQMYGSNNENYGTAPKYTTLNNVNYNVNDMNNSGSNSNYNGVANIISSIHNNRNNNTPPQFNNGGNIENSRNNVLNTTNNSAVNYSTNNNNFKTQSISTYGGPIANPPYYNRNNMLRHNNFMTPNTSSTMCRTDTTTSLRGSYMISSDGEGSPKSVDENDSSPVNCVRGVRTITRNPGRITRQRGNAGISKCNNRASRGRKSTDFTVPKEKDRARSFNEAFDCLRKRIPSIPASKKLSKIEILRLAICYMSYLKFVLENDVRSQNYDSPTISTSTPSPSSVDETTNDTNQLSSDQSEKDSSEKTDQAADELSNQSNNS